MENYIVNTKSGSIRGYERNGMLEYLGIPYAEKPIGELRFKRAVPVKPWKDVLDAKDYGAPSIQFEDGKEKGSEDCLTLNVQRPLTGEKFPVLVWIHGGGYNTGAASVPLTDGKSFVEDGILFVSIQYRLNVLGFYDFTTFKGCEDLDSNCGVSDQIEALHWIHENIASFGGDPENITIMGESAGAASVYNMMVAPKAKGLFQKAIAESGLPNCIMSHEMARENISLFLEGMGWTEEDLWKIRSIDPREMLKGNEYVARKHQYKNPGMYLPGPIQDDLLPIRPIDAVRQGEASGIKLLLGTNLHEGTMFVHEENTGFPNSREMIEEMFQKNGQEEKLSKILDYYGNDKDSFIDFATDYAFQMPALKLADAQKDYADVWMYRYEFVSKSGLESGMRASHAFDMPCVFKNRSFHFSEFLFQGESEETISSLMNNMHDTWVNFIKSGNPDDTWPRFTGYLSKIRIFDRETKTVEIDRRTLMEVWGEMRFYES